MVQQTPEHSEGRLIQAFRERTGKDPDGLWRAPGRVNLIGEHTDYNDGFVLPIAIDRQAVVAGRARSDDVLRIWSLQRDAEPSVHRLYGLKPGEVPGWGAYVAGTAWALSQSAGPLTGADLVIDSTVPLGAGLSSSAALEISAGLALAQLSRIDLDVRDLALAAQQAENDFVGVPCGIMDQMVSAAAKAGHALLLDTRSLEFRHVPFDPELWEIEVVVIDTHTSHSLRDGEYAARRRGCEEAAGMLGVKALRDVSPEELENALSRLPKRLVPLVRHVVTENERVHLVAAALEGRDPQAAGRAINASHESLQSDFRVSSPELDLAVDVCRLTGALGGRMTGAGFGGSAIALTSRDNVAALERQTRIAFERNGMAEPSFFSVTPAAGCSRISG